MHLWPPSQGKKNFHPCDCIFSSPKFLFRVLVLTVAAEIAADIDGIIKGPGTFLPGLIDALWSLTPAQVRKLAKLTVKNI